MPLLLFWVFMLVLVAACLGYCVVSLLFFYDLRRSDLLTRKQLVMYNIAFIPLIVAFSFCLIWTVDIILNQQVY